MALPLLASLPQSGSIVSRWKMDETSGTRVDDVGNNDLTDGNTVAAGASQFGVGSADFEAGNTEYLSIADASQSGLDFSGNFTMSCWVKIESTPSGTGYTLISKMGTTDGDESYCIEYRDFSGTIRLRCYFEDSSNNTTDSRFTTTLTPGVWYHLTAVTTAATPTTAFYLNGVPLGASSMVTSAATSIRNSGASFSVGYRLDPAILPFDGLIQDMMVWSTTLTAAEVESLYFSYFPLPATADLPQNGSIIARWPLTEDAGTRLDIVGANNLTDNNTVASAAGISEAGASAERCADFEASNSEFLSITDNTALSITGDLSGAAWIKIEANPATNAQYAIMTKYATDTSNRSYAFVYADASNVESLQLILSADGSATTVASHTVTLTAGTWYHVGFSYDASATETKLYINGALVSTTGSQVASIYNGTADFQLGKWSNLNNYFDGMMQDVILWSFELSDAEMTSVYNEYATAAATGQYMSLNKGFW